MAYVKQEWKNLPNQTTPANATRMNHIEDGIYDNSVAISNIIESGSNSNGSWIKYSDGTMIITQKYTSSKITVVDMGSLKRVGLDTPPDFPLSFIEPPNVQITLHHCWLAWLMGAEFTPSTTNATTNLIPVASAEQRNLDDVEIHILAIGRWK